MKFVCPFGFHETEFIHVQSRDKLAGRVAEWLKASDSKSEVGAILPEVRILSLPPSLSSTYYFFFKHMNRPSHPFYVQKKARPLLESAMLGMICFVIALPKAEAAQTNPAEKLIWTDIRDLGVEGRGWEDTKSFYDRFPAKAETTVRPAVWNLSRQTAGMLVRFTSDAPEIRARWALTSSNLAMPHMPATGVSGLDLYVKNADGKWHWLGTGIAKAQTNSVTLVSGLPAGKRDYLLYLPLYNGTKFVELGLPKDFNIQKAGAWGRGERKPIVFYGTSILQGGCASRPGMVHTSILGRHFNWPTMNFGFSGNGKMEIEIAELLAELDPSVYVLDCVPNMTPAEVKERVEPFVLRLRQNHPKTPIVLVEGRSWANADLLPERRKRHDDERFELTGAFQRLKKKGIKNLYYVKGESLLGDDGEGTVDGSHPTDLGFIRQAEALGKVLKPFLKAE